MKQLCLFTGVLLASATISMAQGIRVGVHGAYSAGGDVNDSEFGMGAQGVLVLTDHFMIELSGTHFGDSDTGIDIDVTTLGLGARVGYPIAAGWLVYVGGGVHYTLMDADASTIDIFAAFEYGMTASELAEMYGSTVEEGAQMLRDDGISARMDLDNVFGGYISAGVEFDFTENLSLLAEYRYSYSKLKGKINVQEPAGSFSESFDEDYDFGLVRVGLNYRW